MIDNLENEEISNEEVLEETIALEEIKMPLKLDYSIKSMNERSDLVNKIVAQTAPAQLTNRYLEILADYILDAMPKDEVKEKKLLTSNRMITINKRETSLEGLMEKFENGEDGVYNLFSEERNCLLTPKITITDKDIEEVPGLKELRAAIESIEEQAKRATGKRKYLLKRDAIDMRKTQYILKSSHRNPITVMPTPTSQGRSQIDLQERKWIDENGEPQSAGLVSLFNPDHVAAILSHYNGLKIQVKGRHWDDFYYLMQDFDKTVEKALFNFPIYQRIMQLKIDNIQNAEIQEILEKEFNTKYSTVYISSLWCNKIPKLIAETAKEEYLIWYYTYEKPEGAKWKTCSCCGQRKLAHNRFFSKNKSAKDGYYSLCKMCRNKKNKGE